MNLALTSGAQNHNIIVAPISSWWKMLLWLLFLHFMLLSRRCGC